jgi:hypothetical protein
MTMLPILTVETLGAALAATTPVDLLGMRLLRTHPQPDRFPTGITRDALRQAVIELVDYTGRCLNAARHLSELAPIALTGIPLLEYGL